MPLLSLPFMDLSIQFRDYSGSLLRVPEILTPAFPEILAP